jgi:hypothetical protein
VYIKPIALASKTNDNYRVARHTIIAMMQRNTVVCSHCCCYLHLRSKANVESIRWQNWTQVIDAVSTQRDTAGRVEVNERNQLVIHRLLMSDTAPYRLLMY